MNVLTASTEKVSILTILIGYSRMGDRSNMRRELG